MAVRRDPSAPARSTRPAKRSSRDFERAILVVLLVIPLVMAAVFWPGFLERQEQAEEPPAAIPAGTPVPAGTPAALAREERAAATATATLPPAPTPTAVPPPPTLAPPTPDAVPVVVASPTALGIPTAARVGNTGGLGAAVRAEPGGRTVAALRDDTSLQVLERTTSEGAEWVRVRTTAGVEGWILAQVVVAQAGTPVPERPASSEPLGKPTPGSLRRVHVVQPGEQLKQIAARYGVSIWEISAANDIPNPDNLRVGQELVIP